MSSPFELHVSDLHWLPDLDPRDDLCAHGEVKVRIGTEILADRGDGPWCVSAGAFILLRTLTEDHCPERPAFWAEHLIPHCGHAWDEDVSGRLVNLGCDTGVDWGVTHHGGDVRLYTSSESEVWVPSEDWKRAVCRFADTVDAFYRRSEPKKTNNDDHWTVGYRKMRREWRRRRRAA